MSSTPNETSIKPSRILYLGSIASLLLLIFLCVAWELWLAPVRPGGSWLVLKVLPLLLPLRGVLKQHHYTMQWSSMLILLYLTEGLVRGSSDHGLSAWLAWGEVALSMSFFFCTIFYLRPYKLQAKRQAKSRATSAPK